MVPSTPPKIAPALDSSGFFRDRGTSSTFPECRISPWIGSGSGLFGVVAGFVGGKPPLTPSTHHAEHRTYETKRSELFISPGTAYTVCVFENWIPLSEGANLRGRSGISLEDLRPGFAEP